MNMGHFCQPCAALGGSMCSETRSRGLRKSASPARALAPRAAGKMSVQEENQRENVPSSPIDLSYQEFCFEEGSESELSNDLQHRGGRHMACRQAVPFPQVNTDLGPLSPFQKVQPGLKHLHHHVRALCLSQINNRSRSE